MFTARAEKFSFAINLCWALKVGFIAVDLRTRPKPSVREGCIAYQSHRITKPSGTAPRRGRLLVPKLRRDRRSQALPSSGQHGNGVGSGTTIDAFSLVRASLLAVIPWEAEPRFTARQSSSDLCGCPVQLNSTPPYSALSGQFGGISREDGDSHVTEEE